MAAHRLVLTMMGLTILIATALAAALADFGGQGLDRAVHRELASAPGTSVDLSGTLTASQGARGASAVRSAMRSAFGHVPFALYGATWSGALDLPPRPRGTKTVPQVQAAALGGLQARATLLSGSWPGLAAPGRPVPAALPARAAALLHVAAGDVIATRDAQSGKPVLLRVTGVYAARNQASGYWGLDLIGPGGQTSAGGFTTYGPLVVNPAALRGSLTSAAASWAVLPDTARLTGPSLDQVAARLLAAEQALQNPAGPLGGLRVTTSLPAVLRGAASELVVARSLILIGGLELVILGGAALAAAARLLADRQEAELGLLASRGGARWQLAALGVVEPVLVAGVAAALGVAAGAPLARLLSRTGPLRTAGQLISGTPALVWLALVTAATLGTLLALVPALRPNLPGLARVRRGRRACGVAGRQDRCRRRPDRPCCPRRLADPRLLRGLLVAAGHAWHRPGAGRRSGARARGGHPRPAPPAAARRADGGAGRRAPAPARRPGRLAVQPPPTPPGGPRPARRPRGSDRNARALPASDLDPVRAGPGGLPRGRAGAGGRPASSLARAGAAHRHRARRADGDAGGAAHRRPRRPGPRRGRG